jgi:tungstate transport system ATP-binding protein
MRWRRPAPRARLAPSGSPPCSIASDFPKLLLLDEPTANLDPAATRSVEAIVLAAAQSGIKIVMASHDLGQLRRLAGDVIFLIRGALCERGRAADFLDRPTTPEAAAFVRGDLVI